jgi:hypothetical protein
VALWIKKWTVPNSVQEQTMHVVKNNAKKCGTACDISAVKNVASK